MRFFVSLRCTLNDGHDQFVIQKESRGLGTLTEESFSLGLTEILLLKCIKEDTYTFLPIKTIQYSILVLQILFCGECKSIYQK
jgi:hypothetical protein